MYNTNMIVIFSNDLSGLWGIFSGNILGIETILVTHGINNQQEFNGFCTNIYDHLWAQSQTFGNKTYFYKDIIMDATTITIDNNTYPLENIYMIKSEDFDFISTEYTIKNNNFIAQCNNISELIGMIYNKTPNKPPLNSIPHSTSLLKD